MSIRKRVWTSRTGRHEAWCCDYVDQHGTRRLKTFKLKGDAQKFAANTHIEIGHGTHVADSASATVREAGDLWLETSRRVGLEPTTIEGYASHLNLHIAPFIGKTKLSKLSAPYIRSFQDRLHSEGRSAPLINGVIGSLGAILADAQERGLIVRNAVRELRGRRRRGAQQDRHNGKLKVGVDIPTVPEVRALLAAAKGRTRVLLLVAVFTGLRASELRGLRWIDIDLAKAELHVRQRADRQNRIGPPKSAAGERSIPLPPNVVRELREWKLACPNGRLGLIFPNGAGNVEQYGNIIQRGLLPTMIVAGIVKPLLDAQGNPTRDENGRPLVVAKYPGLHALRHFFASWCINRKQDGGLELPLKLVQTRLGHASVTMTADVYGHIFPRSADDSAELATAEALLIGGAQGA